jgi:uncharacterized protein
MNFLTVGVNMRDVACSIKRAGSSVSSVNYFNPVDLGRCAKESIAYLGCDRISTEGLNDESGSWKRFLAESAVEALEKDDFDFIVPRINSEHIDPLKRFAQVLGNSLESLEPLRDKWQCTRAASKHGLLAPKTELLTGSQDWGVMGFPAIIKPVRGSRGAEVRKIQSQRELEALLTEKGVGNRILQEYIQGESYNINFLSDGARVEPIFVSRQLFSDPENLVYSGSVGPVEPEGIEEFVEECTDFLERFKIKGIIGVDFMVDSEGETYFIEVNPRIQGSFEVIEDALGINMFDYYYRAWGGEIPEVPESKHIAGKNIVTAQRDCRAPDFEGCGYIRDIPQAGAFIAAGEPVCTVVATGAAESEVESLLRKRSNTILNLMKPL